MENIIIIYHSSCLIYLREILLAAFGKGNFFKLTLTKGWGKQAVGSITT